MLWKKIKAGKGVEIRQGRVRQFVVLNRKVRKSLIEKATFQ